MVRNAVCGRGGIHSSSCFKWEKGVGERNKLLVSDYHETNKKYCWLNKNDKKRDLRTKNLFTHFFYNFFCSSNSFNLLFNIACSLASFLILFKHEVGFGQVVKQKMGLEKRVHQTTSFPTDGNIKRNSESSAGKSTS